jgi:hypothetical protein
MKCKINQCGFNGIRLVFSVSVMGEDMQQGHWLIYAQEQMQTLF